MTAEDVRQSVLTALRRVAPEIDPATIDPGASLRDEIDLDSMDFLNFAIALHARLGVEIPEAEYPELYTLDRAVSYLTKKLAAREP